jgi:thioredoxin-like negative regulator of GroEL
MKSLIFIISLFFSLQSIAFEYPVKNFRFISEWDFHDEVERSDKYVVILFSSSACLERAIHHRSCFLFEKKLDHFIPSFSKQIKMVGVNTYFENYQLKNHFQITKTPVVIVLKNGQQIDRIEPDFARPDYYRMSWENRFLQLVTSKLYQIR